MIRRLAILFLLALPLLAQDYRPVLTYNAARDPWQDLRDASIEAHRSNRRILLDVGGQWCKWCHFMDRFFTDHPDLRELRDQNYVTVYINFSPDNENKRFLAQFPEIKGYPHLFVLDADGKLIHSEDTSELEDGKSSYVPEKFHDFLTKYVPR